MLESLGFGCGLGRFALESHPELLLVHEAVIVCVVNSCRVASCLVAIVIGGGLFLVEFNVWELGMPLL